FFVDDADGTKVNVIPPDPYKEGYNFMGWYKELEGINKWDFENDIIPSKQYDEEGEYQFIETKIYAKWERIGDK
ncbi:InlB B-repeat-containing protein, partial [Haploplasma axanthum]|uniref:InlB B-repeat-containing protein n=1 Tax=Haploplasma axanthum TaxID=29552 RepID=UPI000550FF4B